MEHRFKVSKYYYTFGPYEPALKLGAGDTLVSDTVDARGCDPQGNLIPDEMKQQREDTEFYPANPLVGLFPLKTQKSETSWSLELER
ncbi:MAG: hypothetical protein NWF14_06420 [Candidatus Bathyarchaeota archaeon]|nr:hypothetical protein [Candidatus Bathyarchaeota archaeon]